MPNIKSAQKRVKVIKTKTLRNKVIKSELKTILKKAENAIATNASDKVEVVTFAVKKLDQASAKGLFHKNCVARKKSQLVTKLNKA